MKPTALPQFPGCKINWCEQRTDEWFKARSGCLTSSTMGMWLVDTEKTAKSRNARDAAVYKVLSDRARWYQPEIFETDAMSRGTALEPLAVADFEKATGLEVADVGFLKADFGPVGCSPDGLIQQDGFQSCGFEGKCPTGAKHAQYIDQGILPAIYKVQVHSSMAISGAKSWWFQSFMAPGQMALRVLVERDQFTEDVLGGLRSFCDVLAAKEEKFALLWNQQSKGGAE